MQNSTKSVQFIFVLTFIFLFCPRVNADGMEGANAMPPGMGVEELRVEAYRNLQFQNQNSAVATPQGESSEADEAAYHFFCMIGEQANRRDTAVKNLSDLLYPTFKEDDFYRIADWLIPAMYTVKFYDDQPASKDGKLPNQSAALNLIVEQVTKKRIASEPHTLGLDFSPQEVNDWKNGAGGLVEKSYIPIESNEPVNVDASTYYRALKIYETAKRALKSQTSTDEIIANVGKFLDAKRQLRIYRGEQL